LAAASPVPQAQLASSPVESKTANHQQNRINSGQQQLKFVATAHGQRVNGPEGEVGRKEPRKGHAVGHKEEAQPKQSEIAMALL